jgi:hypothetical protein
MFFPSQLSPLSDQRGTVCTLCASKDSDCCKLVSNQWSILFGGISCRRIASGCAPAPKRAREDAANALTLAVLSWRDNLTLQPRAHFRGFENMSRGRRVDGEPQIPDLFIRGAGLYAAHLSPETPVGTIQSIEHTLRALDKFALQEEERQVRLEKTLSDYRAQANRPFEHESRLKDLLAQQAQLNAALDLDKGERQAAEPAASEPENPNQLPAAGLPAIMPVRRTAPAPAP